LLAGALAGCAGTAPPAAETAPCATPAPTPGRLQLALTPESFGRTLSLRQQLQITAAGHVVDLDAVVEITPDSLVLVALRFDQRVLTLTQSQGAICEQRNAKLPAEARGADILSDLQLALWPADVIRAALPSGWVLADSGSSRTLTHGGREVEVITFSGSPRWIGRITLRNIEYDYSLVINSILSSP
jgi:hypothetical protein